MRGKLIVIEGTDCSGKETQTDLLMRILENNDIPVTKFSFPNYDSPTGKIVGGPYLGKNYIDKSWFYEGASNVDAKVASLYYAADRKYNLKEIVKALDYGINVVLDRYSYSNMAHQGGKLETKLEREELYDWIEKLEFELLELPTPDIRVFLHMPYKGTMILKGNRSEDTIDEHEKNEEHLKRAEMAYFEIADRFDFHIIECMENDKIKRIDEIQEELSDFVLKEIKK
ncbi:MAG: thymidylate kinase [Firmicutes bacterium]|nr:thymidylate kinase [Bacillota bacterium]